MTDNTEMKTNWGKISSFLDTPKAQEITNGRQSCRMNIKEWPAGGGGRGYSVSFVAYEAIFRIAHFEWAFFLMLHKRFSASFDQTRGAPVVCSGERTARLQACSAEQKVMIYRIWRIV